MYILENSIRKKSYYNTALDYPMSDEPENASLSRIKASWSSLFCGEPYKRQRAAVLWNSACIIALSGPEPPSFYNPGWKASKLKWKCLNVDDSGCFCWVFHTIWECTSKIQYEFIQLFHNIFKIIYDKLHSL